MVNLAFYRANAKAKQSMSEDRGAEPTPSRGLPEYENPPLEEAVIGLQFVPLKEYTSAHTGAFWTRIRDRYPRVKDNPPMIHRTELEKPELPPPPTRTLQIPLTPRCWFITADETELVQLQRDQFFRNWRRVTGKETYPRFNTLFDAFKRDWREFREFATSERHGTLAVDQCELTYINHIDQGAGWEKFSDFGNVFTFLRPVPSTALLSDPEGISWEGTYRLPDGRGRLRIELAPAFRPRDLQLTAQLTVQVRGAPISGADDRVFDWFELAHDWAVRAFDEATDPSMHNLWKKMS